MTSDTARGTLRAMLESAKEADDYRKKCVPPIWVLDYLAEQQLSAGWNVQRSNQCERCFEARSVNGRCGCEYGFRH